MSAPPPLVVLISGSGSNLQALIDGCTAGTIPAKISAVISNRKEAFGLERARQAGIPALLLEHQRFPDRASYDRELAALIEQFNPDAVLLAGFMRILTPPFVQRFNGRLLNIHPSLLPLYTGLNTHQRALEAGDRRHGASVHFVTEELDGGPVVLQAWVDVLPDDTCDTLASRVLEREHIIYPTVTRWFAEGRLALKGEQVLLNGEPLRTPILLGPDDPPPF